VEELEERLGDQMEAVLRVIRDSISDGGVPAEPSTPVAPLPQATQEMLFLEDDDQNWDYHPEHFFDDGGEGAGIEGDLEAEDV
jgi:hypothetical protein